MAVDAGKTFENVLERCDNACFCRGEFPQDEVEVCFKGNVDELFLEFMNTYDWVDVRSVEEPLKFSNTDDWYVLVTVAYVCGS